MSTFLKSLVSLFIAFCAFRSLVSATTQSVACQMNYTCCQVLCYINDTNCSTSARVCTILYSIESPLSPRDYCFDLLCERTELSALPKQKPTPDSHLRCLVVDGSNNYQEFVCDGSFTATEMTSSKIYESSTPASTPKTTRQPALDYESAKYGIPATFGVFILFCTICIKFCCKNRFEDTLASNICCPENCFESRVIVDPSAGYSSGFVESRGPGSASRNNSSNQLAEAAASRSSDLPPSNPVRIDVRKDVNATTEQLNCSQVSIKPPPPYNSIVKFY